ncbi:hypothetical protein M153_36300001, partial [Pseudoloma neurophilia]
TGCTADKKTKFQSLIKKANGRFMDNYEVTMANWGQPAEGKTADDEQAAE